MELWEIIVIVVVSYAVAGLGAWALRRAGYQAGYRRGYAKGVADTREQFGWFPPPTPKPRVPGRRATWRGPSEYFERQRGAR